jgi:hypothetical protein
MEIKIILCFVFFCASQPGRKSQDTLLDEEHTIQANPNDV